MPDVLTRIRDAYQENPAAALSLLPDFFQAVEDGRIVELPCKVGDTVYYISLFGGRPYCGIQEGHVQHVTLSSQNYRIRIREHHPHNTDFALGKTVFLTRAAAEQVLKAGAE